MTYEEALQFWFSRTNYELKSPRPSDLSLGRLRALLRLLGDPHERLRIVHIAGTKGKGSTAAMLAAVLERAGYRTGLFTSPHLTHIEERIQVNGQPISPAELAALMSEVAEAVRVLDSRLIPGALGTTFFEIGTALGFLHFVRRRAEQVVLEVGLGGRFDATNVCQPQVAIITSISFDHTKQLGNTLASIAREKAGIIKPGRPTVSGARPAEARGVIETICRERHSRLHQLDVDFFGRHHAVTSAPGAILSTVQVTTRRRAWPEFALKLPGEHQAANAALVVAAVEELQQQGLNIPDTAVAAGLKGVHWPARLEVLQYRPLVVLDCAHNLASAEALVAALRTLYPPTPAGQRLLIFAGTQDKDVAGMLRVLAGFFDRAWLTQYTSNPRHVPVEQLTQLVEEAWHWPCTICPSPLQAWQAIRAAADPDDLICITGSVFLAGELRSILLKECAPGIPG